MLRTPALLVAICALVFGAASARAEGAKIAVVNTQSVMKDSTAFKAIRDQLDAKQKAYQAEISKQEEALQKNKQELDKQSSALAKEALQAKAKEFQAKVTEIQQQVQIKKKTLDSGYELAVAQIQKTLSEVVVELAKEKGFTVAIPSSQLLYAEASMDITPEVTKRLNEKLPNYTVKFESPKAPEKK